MQVGQTEPASVVALADNECLLTEGIETLTNVSDCSFCRSRVEYGLRVIFSNSFCPALRSEGLTIAYGLIYEMVNVALKGI